MNFKSFKNILSIDIDCQDNQWLDILPNIKKIFKEIFFISFQETQFPVSKLDNIEVSIVLADNQIVKNLNKEYRDKNKPTNVLSFPLDILSIDDYKTKNLEKDIMLGDIVFAFETIDHEAKEQNKSFSDHFYHLLVHATLHLIGYDHENDSDAEIMETLEEKILAKLNIKSPYE